LCVFEKNLVTKHPTFFRKKSDHTAVAGYRGRFENFPNLHAGMLVSCLRLAVTSIDTQPYFVTLVSRVEFFGEEILGPVRQLAFRLFIRSIVPG
jgi:hypothetical protein